MRHAEGRTRASGGRVGCALRYVEESWRERGQSPFASAIAPGGVLLDTNSTVEYTKSFFGLRNTSDEDGSAAEAEPLC